MASALGKGAGFSGNTSATDPGGGTVKPSGKWVLPGRFVMRTSPFLVGVIADHPDGIDRVEFICNDGTPVAVSAMTLETDFSGKPAWAYWVQLESGDYPDSTTGYQIRAVIYGNTGVVRILQDSAGVNETDKSKYVWSDFGNTLSPGRTAYIESGWGGSSSLNNASQPYATITAAATAIAAANGASQKGARFYLKAGTHTLTSQQMGGDFSTSVLMPAEITAAPGVAAANVTIKGTGASANTWGHLLVRNVTLDPSLGSTFHGYGGVPPDLVLMGVSIAGNGRADGSASTGVLTNVGRLYLVDITASNFIAPLGSVSCRDCVYTTISGDAFTNISLGLNNSVDDHTQVGAQHADHWQSVGTGGLENVMLWNHRSTNSQTQNLFIGDGGNTLTSCSFRNIDIDYTGTGGLSQLGVTLTGCVMAFVTIKGQSFNWTSNSDGNGTDAKVKANVFEQLTSDHNTATFAGKFDADDNHLITTAGGLGTGIGSNNTSGAAGWDAATRIPTAAGNLANRITNDDPLWIPFDVDNHSRSQTGTSIGARVAAVSPAEGGEVIVAIGNPGTATVDVPTAIQTLTVSGRTEGEFTTGDTITLTANASIDWQSATQENGGPGTFFTFDMTSAGVSNTWYATFPDVGSYTITITNNFGATNPDPITITVREAGGGHAPGVRLRPGRPGLTRPGYSRN